MAINREEACRAFQGCANEEHKKLVQTIEWNTCTTAATDIATETRPWRNISINSPRMYSHKTAYCGEPSKCMYVHTHILYMER